MGVHVAVCCTCVLNPGQVLQLPLLPRPNPVQSLEVGKSRLN